MNASDEILLGFLVVSLVYRLVRLRIAMQNSRRQGRGMISARPIFWVMTGGYLLFMGSCVIEMFRSSLAPLWSVSILGFVLYVSALALREKAMKDLGRYFSTDIEIRGEHRVIRQGFYQYVRHPLLLCMAIEIVGFALVFNAYGTLVIGGFGFYFPLLVTRQRLEERTLLETLGESYRQYQKDVGAFWPRWHWRSRGI